MCRSYGTLRKKLILIPEIYFEATKCVELTALLKSQNSRYFNI
jgi:hypothetical protein